MVERKSLDDLAQSIVAKSKLSTVQRSVDRHIRELDFWLHDEGVRLQVVCECLAAAGLTRPSGQPLTWRWLGAIVARSRKRQASKPAALATHSASSPVAGDTLVPPPRDSAAPPQFIDVPSRSGRGLESLAVNRKKSPPGG